MNVLNQLGLSSDSLLGLGEHLKMLEPFFNNPREKVWLLAPVNGKIR